MEYQDTTGNKYQISYSQELQQKIVQQLNVAQRMQRRTMKIMMVLILLFALILIAGLITFVYLDQRDAITHAGRLLFCRGAF